MLSYSTVCVLLFALLSSSAILDNCEIDSIKKDINLSSPGYSQFNCSTRYPSPFSYDVTQFVGVWNYVRLFTANPLLTNTSCMRLVASFEPVQKLVMDVEIRLAQDKEIRASVFAFVDDDDAKRESVWNLYSNASMAQSKWIVLSGDERLTLYVICGDYSDGTSALGEIGILSREADLPSEDAATLNRVLDRHGLRQLELGSVSQDDCPTD